MSARPRARGAARQARAPAAAAPASACARRSSTASTRSPAARATPPTCRSAPALVGRILRSPIAHGLIRGIDTAAARAMPGVRAVITGEDFAAPYGVIPIAQNEWPLARDKVRYRGEPLVAVAAIDEATAEAALRAIVLDIEPLPAYFSAADARAEGAVLLHEQQGRQHRAPGRSGLRRCRCRLRRGRPGARAPHYLRRGRARPDRARTPRSPVTSPSASRLTTHSVTQVPYYLHLTLAQCSAWTARASASSSPSSAAASATASSR